MQVPCMHRLHEAGSGWGAQGKLEEPQATFWRPPQAWPRVHGQELPSDFSSVSSLGRHRKSGLPSVLRFSLFVHPMKMVRLLQINIHSAKIICLDGELLFPRAWASLNAWELQECVPYSAAWLHWQLVSDVMSGAAVAWRRKTWEHVELQERWVGFGRGWGMTIWMQDELGRLWVTNDGRMTIGS